jgi:hypothetical protein
VYKKIKNYCDAFVIVTGLALALPPPVVLLQHIVVRVPQAWTLTILMYVSKRELFTTRC